MSCETAEQYQLIHRLVHNYANQRWQEMEVERKIEAMKPQQLDAESVDSLLETGRHPYLSQ